MVIMNEKILKYLNKIQEEKGVEILLACETGSRAWGFPSPDSDYDVRFIYRHKTDWYLSLNEQKDTIEMMFENNEIDLSGWDLKKSLHLLWKSNPPLLERIQSPIIYIADEGFLNGMKDLANITYSKIASMHHYLNMAKKMFSEVKDYENVKLKKLFYALRTTIACQWIIEKDEMPPIVFQKMLKQLDFENNLKQKISDLIELKSTKSESYIHKQEGELNLFIESTIQQAEQKANALPAAKGQIEDLNQFFRKTLYSR
jgi:predicted nucleotidyltransferase